MNALAVTAFYDIGRGSWEALSRTRDAYISYYRHYLARLPLPRYLLAGTETQRSVSDTIDFADVLSFDQLPAYRFLERTERVVESAEFRSLFDLATNRDHVEHIHAKYNIVCLAKWDALERAYALTRNTFSYYVWVDFGLGHGPRGYLPEPLGFQPIERGKIVISAERENGIASIEKNLLVEQIRRFTDQTATSVMIVPAELVVPYCQLARANYERLLDWNLASDDQVVADMCVAARPDLFSLSYAPRGLTKFNHIHNILNGLDTVQPRSWNIPIYDRMTKRLAKRRARKRLGLD